MRETQGAAPYLVRKGWLELTTDKPHDLAERAQQVAREVGGVLQNATVTDERARLVLRVPEPRLEETLDKLSTLGKVDSRRVDADDVTAQVIDLDARVASLISVRDRLRSLLDRAANMTEIMSVERELARVQADIDVLEGRVRYLRSNAAMSELSLSARRERILGPIGFVVTKLGELIGKLFVIQ